MIASLEHRVARRFLARDFATEKALEKYLHEHPKADRHNHQVVKQQEHGKKDDGGGHDDEQEDHAEGGMLGRLKGSLKALASKLKDAPADVQKFVADPKHRKTALQKGVQALKKAPGKYAKQLVKTAKHEVHEFKAAGKGVAAVMKGKKPSADQKKAIKAVAVHMGITIAAGVLTTATPLLATLAIGEALGKHIALKAALKVLGDLHVLEEFGHIGHGVHHGIEGLVEFLKFGAEGKGAEKVTPEEALAGLVMKHVAKIMKNLDDDTLAEGLGGGAGDQKKAEGKEAASRIARLYLQGHSAFEHSSVISMSF